jgi:uncharacterized membrane protein
VIEVLGLLAVLMVFFLVLGPIVLSIIALARSRRVVELRKRLDRLEILVQELTRDKPGVWVAPAPPPKEPEPPVIAEAPVLPELLPRIPGPVRAPSMDWESLIGRRALGWVAVVLIVFSTGFFLRYAFENNWIGPIGRVALAAAAGMALVGAGWHYDRRRGWRLFSQMLTSAGVVLFFLATYAAFGFYHLLPQRFATIFLLVIVVETMGLAVLYNAPALALVAVLGGLLTPILLQSETDQYSSLFLYLGVLNTGVVVLALWRQWPAITSVALVGTQMLFWSWYGANYHPEKLGAALGFQAAVFLLFLGRGLAAHGRPARPARWEDIGRWLLNAFLGFLAAYVLLDPDYATSMGALALGLATVYAALALWMIITRPDDERLFLTTLAIAVGLIATAFPIQAEASWIALGWAAEAGALWWFGLRVRQAPLRALAAALGLLSVGRILVVDTMNHQTPHALLILNDYALPAIGASICLLLAVVTTRRLHHDLSRPERIAIATVEVGVILQLWLVLSVDVYQYYRTVPSSSGASDDRLAQMVLSVLWAVYASVLLAIGFRVQKTRLRWTALGLFGATVVKVFVLDMSGLDEVYRILAFFVLAILLGVAARIYQRLRPEPDQPRTAEV